MHDDYKQLETPPGVEHCPVCGSEPQLWQYSESPNAPVKRLVMCSHGDKIGPRNGLIHEGCLLYIPGDDFYRETARDAVRFWNEFAKALNALRRSNNWKRARPLRSNDSGVETPDHICPECSGNLTDEEGTPCSTCRGGPDNWKPTRGVSAPVGTRLRDLIDRYWSLAYAEGKEGREHDTEDGAAQQCRGEIEEILRGLDGVGEARDA